MRPRCLCEARHAGITPPIYDRFSETAGVCEPFYLGGLYIAGGAVAGVSALPQHAARRSSGTRRYELDPGSWYPPAVLCCTVLYCAQPRLAHHQQQNYRLLAVLLGLAHRRGVMYATAAKAGILGRYLSCRFC